VTKKFVAVVAILVALIARCVAMTLVATRLCKVVVLILQKEEFVAKRKLPSVVLPTSDFRPDVAPGGWSAVLKVVTVVV